ncbi:MAG: hypothetical protein QOI95_668 [Acidimicrobiaceae bacterium]|jgi:hypothetical protein
MHGPLEAAEDMAEVGLAGIPPMCADTANEAERADVAVSRHI